jgi:hypothetical protein
MIGFLENLINILKKFEKNLDKFFGMMSKSLPEVGCGTNLPTGRLYMEPPTTT